HFIMELKDPADIEAAVTRELRNHFRPEFLNRVDETIIFHQLTREDLREVVDVQLERFSRRLEARDLRARFTDEAKDLLGELGYDPAYGARPLKRAIQRYLENPLAQDLLAGKYSPGDT